jgi:hypothetical protein
VCRNTLSKHRSVPRWGRLYAIVAAGAVAAVVTRAGLPASPLRAAILTAIPVLTGIAVAWWTALNRVALDLVDWCDCAAATVTVRVIMAEPRPATPRPMTRRRSEAAARTTLQP